MAIKINLNLRKFYADKTFDLVNIGAGALLFGQFLSDNAFSWTTTISGLSLIVIGYFASYMLYKGGDRK